ncbi:hypothetical protein AMATHDRAFT_142246 [Amanita thiersii Skay4041]|uniref:Mechanosensitive ion channel protein n=1 Tax=Amanita thiersii Skay4041 TaxID=703135 RepID=A0A2A9NLR7_9AGAR|nr:hypothetical protein AMATHDRAFT_142246 [Amanita thiersii Skay4041]
MIPSPPDDQSISYPPSFPNPRPASTSSPLTHHNPYRPPDVDQSYPASPAPVLSHGEKVHQGRSSSWDLFAGLRRFEHSYEEFDTRNAREDHLVFADGDMPKNRFTKFYNYLLNVSIVTRWAIFIIPVLGVIWIPGILGITTFPNANVWGVKLLWWSIWLTIVWAGWWAALAASRVFPRIVKSTIGVVAVGTRRYIDWMQALHRYIALFGWTLAIWVSWTPLVAYRQATDVSSRSAHVINLIGRVLFAFFLCAAILLFEKFSIQWIAGKFHERSYAERITDQKFAVKSLVTLYRHSSDIPGRSDPIGAGHTKSPSVNPKRLLKRLRDGVRMAATTTTTALGNVASEIAGSSVLQPNSPQAMVKTALESANKSRLLARRLFHSFAQPGHEFIYPKDIERYFTSQEEAERAFALFDKDSNGDASLEEMEMACLEIHREQLSIENSMRDLDSAVGRLDNILMSVYTIIAIIIIAIALEAQFATLITGAGTLVLGLSWLIGGSLQEVLVSIIFLFVKHPYDVGDRVQINKEFYTVKEIRLLSTVFIDSNSAFVQAANSVLSTLWIQNIRRSPQMSETFTFDVAYATTFEDLEKLRDKMLEFVKSERRDFQPIFDVSVKDFPDQEKMTLMADIKYKSNWQQGALKVKRRNKWLCALKSALAEVKIYGPQGDPDASPSTTRYTEVPWEVVQAEDRKAAENKAASAPIEPAGGWRLSDNNAAICANFS